MQRSSRSRQRVPRRIALVCASALLSTLPAVAWAFTRTADSLCRSAAAAAGPADPTVDAMIEGETRQAEQAIEQAGEAIPSFTPSGMPTRADAAPGAAPRAAYCAAIGELARRGGFGNPLDAPGYLDVAYQLARQANADPVSAMAAFRLGMTMSSTATTAGLRGVRMTGLEAEPTDEEEDVTRSLPRARRRVAMLDQPRGKAACDMLAQGGYPPAAVALSCAATLGDNDLMSRADLELARLLITQARLSPAQAPALRAAASDLAVQPLKVAGWTPTAAIRLRLVETALDALRPGDRVDPAVLQAVAAGESDGENPGVQAWAMALHGRIVGLTDRAAAMAYIDRAIATESSRATPTRLSDWYMLAADMDPDRRAEHVRSAYDALASVRALLPLRDPVTEESTFQLHERRVFEARIGDVLNSLPTTSPDAASRDDRLTGRQAADLGTAQDILEAFRQAEVSDAFGNECVPTPLRVQAQQLRPDELILYPVILPDRVELIFLRGGRGGHFRRLPPAAGYGRESVARLVNSFRQALVNHSRSGWQAPSRELYDLLIKPVENQLSPRDTLVVIPDATLSALPFSALRDAEGRFLIQKTRLAIAPGLDYAQPGSTRAGRHAFVAAGSLDRDVPLSFGVFPKLENAAQEARMAAGSTGGKTAATGVYMADFSADDVRKVLRTRNVDVLHLATHAEFSGGTDKSFIVANGGFITLRELSAIIASNRVHGRTLDLLVLSACETAVGDDRSSLGLAGAAVQSGARGALATLWPVDDASTRMLMDAFYKAYRGGASKAEAIQSAQTTVMAQKDTPYYWASLILIGGWR